MQEKIKNTTDLFLHLSSGMLSATNLDAFLHDTLVDVGNALHVHRVYIFSYDGKGGENTYSWVYSRLPPFRDLLEGSISLQDAMYADGMFTALQAGEPYIIHSVKKFKDTAARKIFEEQKIAGLIIVPLFSEGKLSAFFGVDQCFGVEQYGVVEDWAERSLRTILTLGQLLNNAIHYFSALQLLENKQEEVQELFDMLPFPMYITDPETYTVLCHNKTLSEYLGGISIVGQKCHDKIMDNDKPCSFCSSGHLTHNGEPHIWDLRGYKGGLDFRVIDSCIPWDDLELARFAIAIDITDSLRMQRERVLDMESTKAQSRFLANMSHELRTPLNGIVGMMELAMEHNEDEKVGEYLNKASLSSKKLLKVINDILDFSKLEAGKLELEQHPFSPQDLCREVQELLIDEAQAKGFEVTYTVDASVPQSIVGDALRFGQIIGHLVKNSIKFTEKGVVSFSLSLCSNETCSKDLQNTLTLCLVVQDTGIGMSEEVLQQLFMEFTQADSSSTRRHGGTGLGLTIVESLLDLMGGRISVESVEGHGSTFTCYIPFLAAENSAEIAEQDISIEDISGTSILLAEDNEINAIIAQEALEHMGCQVDWVQDGYMVLQKIDQKHYDMILMDVHMPNMDGIESTKRIRNDARFHTIPIIALTAHVLAEEIDKCYAAGMQGHALKPISTKALHQIIARLTKKPFKYSG